MGFLARPFWSSSRLGLRRAMLRVCDCPQGSERYLAMEGLRGVAVFAVFLCHYDVIITQRLSIAPSAAGLSALLGRLGTCGVDLFFVLSGFLIYRLVLQPTLRYPSFVLRRAQRIYPPFVAVLLFFLAVSLLNPSLSKLPKPTGEVWGFLLMNLVFLPGFVNVEPIVSVAWSLSYEWYFYLTLPIIAGLLHLYEWKGKTRIFFFAAFCILYLAFAFELPSIGQIMHYPIYRSHVRLVMFLGGIIAYEVCERRLRIPPSFWRRFEWDRGGNIPRDCWRSADARNRQIQTGRRRGSVGRTAGGLRPLSLKRAGAKGHPGRRRLCQQRAGSCRAAQCGVE